MLASALLAGLLAGLLFDLGKVARVLLMAHTPPSFMIARYRRPLPLVGISVPFGTGKKGAFWRGVVLFCGDLFFCLACFAAVELILFYFNDGAFRLLVPVLLLAGVALWRYTAARAMALFAAWLAYALGAALVYFWAIATLPFRLARRYILRPAWRLVGYLRDRRRCRISAVLCREQLMLAATGLTDQNVLTKKKRKGKKHGEKAEK
jgi:hypothetical protein